MFDHVSIGVADIARSKKFYDAALKPLGFSRLSDGETSLGYGEKAVQLWLGAVGNRCAWCARPRRSGGRVARGRVRIRRGRARR
ncbi:MAG TPA: hypothetical protein VLL30_02440 [Reyranella sp.]|nr:hypothetical protein [Reyranella sp.]